MFWLVSNIDFEAIPCLDINECNTNNGGCDHNCINTQGSYQCQCRVGYETNNNGINCTGMTKF